MFEIEFLLNTWLSWILFCRCLCVELEYAYFKGFYLIFVTWWTKSPHK